MAEHVEEWALAQSDVSQRQSSQDGKETSAPALQLLFLGRYRSWQQNETPPSSLGSIRICSGLHAALRTTKCLWAALLNILLHLFCCNRIKLSGPTWLGSILFYCARCALWKHPFFLPGSKLPVWAMPGLIDSFIRLHRLWEKRNPCLL